MNSVANDIAGILNSDLSKRTTVSSERLTIMTDTTKKSAGLKSTRDIVDIYVSPQYSAQLMLEKVNENIAAQFGATGVTDADILPSTDTSPQGTAGAIFDFAISFYDAYKEQHAGEDEAEVLDNFMSAIRGAIDDGFAEALDILSGMTGFDDEISTGIDDTYNYLQEMLDDFYEEQQEQIG